MLIARDPVARADLHDGLVAMAPDDADLLDQVQVAEGELARWLSDVTELGRVPDELEHLTTVAHPTRAEQRLHLFRFRMHAPHWSAARGWMIGSRRRAHLHLLLGRGRVLAGRARHGTARGLGRMAGPPRRRSGLTNG